MCILINGISWNITLDGRPHLLTFALLRRGAIPLRPTFPNLLNNSLLVEFWFLHLHYRLFVLGLLCVPRQGPQPNIYSWTLYPYKSHSHPHKCGAIWYMCWNTCFQFLNNITCIFTFFLPTCILKKIKNCYLNTYTKRVHSYWPTWLASDSIQKHLVSFNNWVS